MDQHPDFKSILLTRHSADETICVSAYKTVNGEFVVSERFCNGVQQAAGLIQRSYERQDIGAIWTNIQRLKPGSDRRKKGETIDRYTNLTIDIDRKFKRIHEDGTYCLHNSEERRTCGSYKCNATNEEVETLRQLAEKVTKFLVPAFGPSVFAFSGNGWHLNWKLADLDPQEGQQYYKRLLALLKAKFEQQDLNVEIDASLADDTQVVTCWGTHNRKYPDALDRPQRQSKIVFQPTSQKPIKDFDLEIFLTDNRVETQSEPLKDAPRPTTTKVTYTPDPEWLENYGVPDLIDFYKPLIAYEGDTFEKDGDTLHPIRPCPCHDGEDLHDHSHTRDCCIIEFKEGGIGIRCFSGGTNNLKAIIKKLNELKGEKYPHRVFLPTDEEIAAEAAELKAANDAMGVVDADAIVASSPLGGVCYREHCQCGNVHVQREKPKELFENGEFELTSGIRSDGTKSSLVVIRASDIKSKPITWLWPNRIPRGKGVILQGMPGKGKSQAGLDFIARLSSGRDWPDDEKNEHGPKKVLWMGTEDDPEDTVKPRLQALGANMENIMIVQRTVDHDGSSSKKRKLTIQRDMALLLKALNENPDIAAILFDPISGFYGDADPNSSKDVRPIMEGLATVARQTGVTMFAIMHENRRKDVSALERTLGSSSVGQVFRLALRFSEDPKESGGFIMATSKSNFKTKGGLKYTIEEADITYDNGETGKREHIVWGAKHEQSADDVLADAKQDEKSLAPLSAVEKAMVMLEGELADGKPHRLAEIHKVREIQGISEAAMRRARYKLDIEVIGAGQGPWFWKLNGKPSKEGYAEYVNNGNLDRQLEKDKKDKVKAVAALRAAGMNEEADAI